MLLWKLFAILIEVDKKVNMTFQEALEQKNKIIFLTVPERYDPEIVKIYLKDYFIADYLNSSHWNHDYLSDNLITKNTILFINYLNENDGRSVSERIVDGSFMMKTLWDDGYFMIIADHNALEIRNRMYMHNGDLIGRCEHVHFVEPE